MIDRDITAHIRRIACEFPIVGIMGPRQSGKTTLAKMLFPEYSYVNFERENVLSLANCDLEKFIAENPPPVIFDEVQRCPKVLNEIQVWVDEHPERTAAYVVTGSDQPELRGVISESLAGRIGLSYLLPFSFNELRGHTTFDRAESVLKGFLPRMYSQASSADLLYDNYFSTYVRKDVNKLINLKDTSRFVTFMRLMAARVGQILNYESISCEVGVSVNTIKDWLNVLEASFIVFRLYPYYRNFGKRFVKTPKIYFTEVGLATYLLDLTTREQLVRDPLFGQLFENMVVADIRKNRLNQGLNHGGDAGMYFIRDKTGNEIDVVLEDSRKLDLVEIKSGMSFNPDYAKSIEKFAKIIPEFNQGRVIYAGAHAVYHGIEFVNFAE